VEFTPERHLRLCVPAPRCLHPPPNRRG
jgi:hypothetical protein